MIYGTEEHGGLWLLDISNKKKFDVLSEISHIHLVFHQKSSIERGWSMKLVWKVRRRRVSVQRSGLLIWKCFQQIQTLSQRLKFLRFLIFRYLCKIFGTLLVSFSSIKCNNGGNSTMALSLGGWWRFQDASSQQRFVRANFRPLWCRSWGWIWGQWWWTLPASLVAFVCLVYLC